MAKTAGSVRKPTLNQALFALFAVLGLMEGLFIWILCDDILKVNQTATREFKIVKASRDVVAACDQFATTKDNSWYWDPSSTTVEGRAKTQNIRKLKSKLDQLIDLTIRDMVAIGVSPAQSAEMKTSVDKTFQLQESREYVNHHCGPAEQEQAFEKLNLGTLACDRQFLHQIRGVNKLIKQAPERLFMDLPPEQLLYVAAVFNIVYLVCAGLCVRFLISRPVSQLADGCERITQGLALLKTPVLSSELDALQENFYQMSRQIIENDKRRKSYISLLQTVQLSVITTVSERLSNFARTGTLSDKARRKLETACNNLANLVKLLKSMTQSLSNAGRQQPIAVEKSRCSTNALLAEVNANVEALLQERNIKLVCEKTDYQIDIDAVQIRRVLLNFVSNAIKYSPDGSTITVSVVSDEKNIRFNVQDRGPGISSQGRAKLFQRFSQLEALDGVKRAGTGLGLVICKELVEAHDGQVGCDSEPGAGSCFWFSLPNTASETPVLSETKQGQTRPARQQQAAKKEKTGSMISRLAFTWLFFLVIQSFLFFQLNSMLGALKSRAEKYATQRELLLGTQELFARQIVWAEQIGIIGRKRQLGAVPALLRSLKKIKNDLSLFYARGDKTTNQFQDLDSILKAQTELIRMIEYGMEHVDEILADAEAFRKRVERVGYPIGTHFYKFFDSVAAGFNASYDWSKQLRADMLTVLIVAAGADFLVIGAALLVGMRIARRISLLKSKALDFASGAPITPSLSGRDELTFLDRRLCEVSDDIRRSEAERQELMAVINHDLRTPLASVLSVLEMLSSGIYGALPENELSVVGKSDDELKALLMQINDLLTLEKIDSGAYDLSLQTLPVGEILSESVNSVSKFAAARSVDITLSAEPDVSNLELRGDKQLLVRLIAIVLKNAVDNSAEQTTLKLNVHKSDGLIALDVVDCGTGIAPELLPVIFQRFRFIDGKPLGGLGLPLAFRVCQMHEGEIQIKQSSPAGTIVGISLPLAV